MRDLKYVIVSSYGHEVPIIFSHLLSHDAIARKENVLAAGFCSLDATHDKANVKATCWGLSASLNCKSRGVEDAEIITNAINMSKMKY